jgi:hypothetical protein
MARSDSLRTTLDFGVALYQGMLPGLSTSPPGAVWSPPFDRPAFATCRLPYAEAVLGCSRIPGPDCFLRLFEAGSARSNPYGGHYRRGRVHSRCGLQLRFSSLRRPDLAERRRLTTGLLWWLARTGLTPAGRSALLLGTPTSLDTSSLNTHSFLYQEGISATGPPSPSAPC